MAGLSASGLKTQIRSYTETDSNVLTDSVLENIILNAQYRIFRDVPIDADRKQQEGNLVAGQETINAPAGAVFIRGAESNHTLVLLNGVAINDQSTTQGLHNFGQTCYLNSIFKKAGIKKHKLCHSGKKIDYMKTNIKKTILEFENNPEIYNKIQKG